MSPEKFIPRKVGEITIADITETRQLLERAMPGVDDNIRMAEVYQLIDQAGMTEGDVQLQDQARRMLKWKILAYKYWRDNVVKKGAILRGNISLWQKTADPDEIEFTALFGYRQRTKPFI